jgi:hypothetical protein
MSIEEIQSLKERIGLKLYNAAIKGEKGKKLGDVGVKGRRKEFKRENKVRRERYSREDIIIKGTINRCPQLHTYFGDTTRGVPRQS